MIYASENGPDFVVGEKSPLRSKPFNERNRLISSAVGYHAANAGIVGDGQKCSITFFLQALAAGNLP
jgi:hypothetical protein